MLDQEKRRSDRLMLTIPLRAVGVDPEGRIFESLARTVVLSRHGAEVRVAQPLHDRQRIRLVNTLSNRGADFQVVRTFSIPGDEAGSYALACLDADPDIWEIRFPAPADGAVDARALLECRMCHAVALSHLTRGELEALRTMGFVGKSCEACKKLTPARFAEVRSNQEESVADAEAPSFAGLRKMRRHPRICLQAPLGVRDDHEGFEVTKTENVSRGGFCFTSERDYQPGQLVMVVFPNQNAEVRVEIPGQIVWQHVSEGTRRKVYGMHCERQGD